MKNYSLLSKEQAITFLSGICYEKLTYADLIKKYNLPFTPFQLAAKIHTLRTQYPILFPLREVNLKKLEDGDLDKIDIPSFVEDMKTLHEPELMKKYNIAKKTTLYKVIKIAKHNNSRF